MKRFVFCVAILVGSAIGAMAEPIQIENETRAHLHLHFATIDLSDPTVSLRLIRSPTSQPSGWETSLQLPSDVAQRENLSVAVNGDLFSAKESLQLFDRKTSYFVGNPANVCGWAMSDGQLWAQGGESACLVVLRDGSVRIGAFDRLPAEACQAVGGSNIIVLHGRNVASAQGKNNQNDPRTAAGIDVGGRRLVLLVVDGHRPEYSVGLTLRELADELIRRGCADAINLDGGGSSVMVKREKGTARVMSRPSDGYDLPLAPSLQRPVASVLGVICSTQPTSK